MAITNDFGDKAPTTRTTTLDIDLYEFADASLGKPVTTVKGAEVLSQYVLDSGTLAYNAEVEVKRRVDTPKAGVLTFNRHGVVLILPEVITDSVTGEVEVKEGAHEFGIYYNRAQDSQLPTAEAQKGLEMLFSLFVSSVAAGVISMPRLTSLLRGQTEIF